MSDQYHSSSEVPVEPTRPGRSGRSSSSGLLTWVIGAAIVLILAIAGGLFTAWLVANMRAVPGPVGAASPTPTVRATAAPSSASESAGPGETRAPRRTPTPMPTVEVTPEPFVHVVERGESLRYIASLYDVTVAEIQELNDIANANRIQVGQELRIPGHGVRPTPRP